MFSHDITLNVLINTTITLSFLKFSIGFGIEMLKDDTSDHPELIESYKQKFFRRLFLNYLNDCKEFRQNH